jgi:hypothetical protein
MCHNEKNKKVLQGLPPQQMPSEGTNDAGESEGKW